MHITFRGLISSLLIHLMDKKVNPYEQSLPEVLDIIRAATSLSAQDVTFHASVDKSLGARFEHSSRSLYSIAGELFKTRDSKLSLTFGKKDATSEFNWKAVTDCLDVFFESIDSGFDELRKPLRKTDIIYLEDKSHETGQLFVKEKPQQYFSVPIDNSETRPFKPKLQFKPHAMHPLENASLEVEESTGFPLYEQPYVNEIMNSPYPESVLTLGEVKASKEWKSTSAIWVNDKSSLTRMINELEESTEIAVDLEHHDFRSYYGITCLMQISSREQDWVIDTLALRDDLSVLNTIFANPKILKVFHGANMDIIWLQRDLGLYVVSLFDTYFASRALGLPKFSLAYLLEYFANFRTSKKYQLADWRIRPLPAAMLEYARSDTHFLLNIYDQIRNKLLESSSQKLQDVLAQSRKVACKKFEYPRFSAFQNKEGNFLHNDRTPLASFLSQYNVPRSKHALAKEIFNWRDSKARELDESPRFILSNRFISNICRFDANHSFDKISELISGFSDVLRQDPFVLSTIIHNRISREKDHKIFSQDSRNELDFRNTSRSFAVLSGECEVFLNKTCKTLIRENSQVLVNNSGNVFAFSVRDSNLHCSLVENEELHKRLTLLRSSNSSFEQRRVSGSSAPDAQSPESNIPISYNSENSEIRVQDHDANDLMTLTKKRSRRHQENFEGSEEINYDYSKGNNKILGNIESKSKFRKVEQRKDPKNTGKPSEVHRVAPKGKSVSFKRKFA